MKKQKISEMVVDFAGEFISEGETVQERRNGLNTACIAWNCACAPEGMRQQLVDQWVLFYQAENPEADAEVCQVFREYLEMLIQKKLAKYPHCNREIISCELNEMDDGQDHITIPSAMMPDR